MGSNAGEQLSRLRDIAVHLICGFILTLLVLIAASAHSYIFELFTGRAQDKEPSAPKAPCLSPEAPRPARSAPPKKPHRRVNSATPTNAPSGVAQGASICKAEISTAPPVSVDVSASEATQPPPPPARPRTEVSREGTQPSEQVFIRPRRVNPPTGEASAPSPR